MSRRCRRWARRAVLAGVGLVVAMLGIATPAWAWCEGDPPDPKAPDSGMVGFFVIDPEVDLETDPGDPFDDPENVSLADTYGFPYHWATYDLGCGPDAARDPGAVVFTQAANFTFDIGLATGAFAQTVQDFVYDGPLHFLNDPMESTQDAVFDKIWTVWFPVALMGVGVVVIARAKRADMSENTTIVLVVAVVLAASTYFLTFPAKAADMADEAIGTTVQTVTAPFDDSARIEEQMSRAIFYPAWLEGMFGSPDSAVAEKYGPPLFRSMHYSWVEWQMINDGGVSVKEIIDANKGESFEETAAILKSQYPGEYRVMVGKESADRLGVAFMMMFYSASAAFVVCVGMGLILLAMLIIRGFIVAFPLAGIAGIYPQGRATLLKLWDYLAAAIWCVIKFSFATGLFLVMSGSLLSSDMPGVMKYIVLIVMTIAVMMFARPFRTAKAMVPGLDPNHSYFMGAMRRMRHRRAMRNSVEEGVRDGMEAEDESADDPGHERPVSVPEEESLPPLPPPRVATAYAWGDDAAQQSDPAGAYGAGFWPGAAPGQGSGAPAALPPAGDRSAGRPSAPATAAAIGPAGQPAGPAAGSRQGAGLGWPADHAGPGAPGDDGTDHAAGQVIRLSAHAVDPDDPTAGTVDGVPTRGDETSEEWTGGLPSGGQPAGYPVGQSGSGGYAGERYGPVRVNGSIPVNGSVSANGSVPANGHDGPAGRYPTTTLTAAAYARQGRPRSQEPEPDRSELLEPLYRGSGRPVMPSEMDMIVADPEPIVAEPVIDEKGNEVFMIYTREDRL